jgi:ribosomal protein S28E/S33
VARSEREAERTVAPPATAAAYAVVRRLAEVWGVRGGAPEVVLVTDGDVLEVLGRGGLAASYASQARHRFRPGGDPVVVLQRLCQGSTYFHVDGPTVVAEPVEELVGQLADRYGLAPLSTIR